MKSLRIALAFLTAHRNSAPVVLATGTEPAALQAAVDQAPGRFLRFEFGVFTFQRKARRRGEAPSALEELEAPADIEDLSLAYQVQALQIEELGADLSKERDKAKSLEEALHAQENQFNKSWTDRQAQFEAAQKQLTSDLETAKAALLQTGTELEAARALLAEAGQAPEILTTTEIKGTPDAAAAADATAQNPPQSAPAPTAEVKEGESSPSGEGPQLLPGELSSKPAKKGK